MKTIITVSKNTGRKERYNVRVHVVDMDVVVSLTATKAQLKKSELPHKVKGLEVKKVEYPKINVFLSTLKDSILSYKIHELLLHAVLEYLSMNWGTL